MSTDSSTSIVFPTPTVQESDSFSDTPSPRRRPKWAKLASRRLISQDSRDGFANSAVLLTYIEGNSQAWDATYLASLQSASTEPKLAFRREDLPALVEQLGRDDVGAEDVEALLRKIFARYGEDAVSPVAQLCLQQTTSDELVERVANTVARFAGTSLETSTLQLLLTLLSSNKPVTREIALMALDFMHDKRALGTIQRALGKEQSRALRPIFKSVIDALSAKA